MSNDIVERVARAIYEADPEGGFDADDPKTFWMAEDGYWPPSTKQLVWDHWLIAARAAIGIMQAEIERLQARDALWDKANQDNLEAIKNRDVEIERLRAQVARDDEHYQAAMFMSEKHRKNWVESSRECKELRAEIEQQTISEKRIEMIELLKTLRKDNEKPGTTILRALRFLRVHSEEIQ